MNKFTEKTNSAVNVAPQDIDTSDVTGAVYLSMANHRKAIAEAFCATPGAGKILTVQLKQATSAGGAGAKNLGSAVTATAVSTEALVAVAEANVEELDKDNGFLFVSATVGTDKGSSVIGGCLLLRQDGRFSE